MLPIKNGSFFIWVFLVSIFTIQFLQSQAQFPLCNPIDRSSLLSFFSNITSTPWQSSPSSDCCGWEGISCSPITGRITRVELPYRGLFGTLSIPSNLTALTHLNLSHNRLYGNIPNGFFSSNPNLEVLDLSYNRLTGVVSFPDDDDLAIQIADFSSNLFHGEIVLPAGLAWNLTSFNVSNNSFVGLIPSSICSIGTTVLDFSFNDFSGSIPPGFGNCSRLEILRAGFNNLSGLIPDDIYRIDSLQELSLSVNHLTGSITDDLVNLVNLKSLELFSNQLVGPIPEGIGKLEKLENLQLHVNNLTRFLPLSLANCTNLVTLILRVNSLAGQLDSFNFSKLQKLTTLDLGNNNFTGNLPSSLFSCTSLTALRFASNQLSGQVSARIQSLQSLAFLSISNNRFRNFTGALRIFTGCKNLSTLILSKNFYYEAIPQDENLIGPNGFQNIRILALGGCKLSGQIPAWLAKIKTLGVLDLSFNEFNGSIPGWFGSLPSLFYMDLSNNQLSGDLPMEITELKALVSPQLDHAVDKTHLELPVFVNPNNATITNLQYNQLASLPPAIYLGNNSLSGKIPEEIGRLKGLHVLDFSSNNFSMTIPDEISNLTNLENLDLSGNHLSGQIPVALKGLHFLSSFDVAGNDLQGSIPTGGQFDTFPSSSFEGNPGLCGVVLQRSCPGSSEDNNLRPNSRRKKGTLNAKVVVGLVLGICFGTGLLIAVMALWILSKRRIIPGGDIDKVEMDTYSSNSYPRINPDDDTSLVMLFPNIANEVKDLTIMELLKATDNFSQANIVGCGGFGLVYKATLANGTKLAVKKLSGDFGLMEREFKAEIEALSTAQHENLVSLQGYCVFNGFRLLIYSYMENGSLDYWLHEKTEGASQLDWPTRLKIAKGASIGLAYMHQVCEPHIVHRDIKSSNILLDEKFEAHVADFGLARLIRPYCTHVTTELVGTLGYIPPEYGQAWIATLRGDVYSFGVVMLELLSGKRPVEVFKPKMSRELVAWVYQMRSEGKQEQVFDPILRDKGHEDEMLQMLDVACMCVSHNPRKRPSIQEVVDCLKNIGCSSPQKEELTL
ncbi:Tyrosine-sulfated glycopeptide receptor 1 [Linum perenne]